MIDFRYHVVSLTAIFLALAVGVVLGSGPLRTALVSELTNETAELKDALADSKAETAEALNEARIGEEFVDQAADLLIGGVLDDRNVAVVRILSPDGAEVTGIRERIIEAGGAVTANLSIESAWTDETLATFRTAFAAQISESVVGVDATVSPAKILAHAIAQTLVPTEFPEDTEVGSTVAANASDRSEVLLDLLIGAELVSGSISGEVDSVVFVVGVGPNSDDDLSFVSDIYADVVGVMDEYVDGTVVATGPSRFGDVSSAVQASAFLDDAITTVSDALNHFGHFTVVLALAKEIEGEAGHYGYGQDLLLFPEG